MKNVIFILLTIILSMIAGFILNFILFDMLPNNKDNLQNNRIDIILLDEISKKQEVQFIGENIPYEVKDGILTFTVDKTTFITNKKFLIKQRPIERN